MPPDGKARQSVLVPDDNPGASAPQPAQEDKVVKLPRRTREEREFLPAALEIMETPPSPVGRAIGITIVVLAVVAAIWAFLGHVDIIVTTTGRIIPQGKTKIVQPLQTGIVSAIHVSDGDEAKAGAVLIELNAAEILADRDRFRRDLLHANLDVARLRGLVAAFLGQTPEGADPKLIDPPQDATAEELALTEAAMRAQATNAAAMLAQIDGQ